MCKGEAGHKNFADYTGQRPGTGRDLRISEFHAENSRGPIQILYPFQDPVALICHEEGKLLGLPLNRSLRDDCGQIYDAIAGTFFLCGAPPDTDHLDSIPEELISKYRNRFASPEIFIRLNGRIVCILVR